MSDSAGLADGLGQQWPCRTVTDVSNALELEGLSSVGAVCHLKTLVQGPLGRLNK